MNELRIRKRSASMAYWFEKYVEGDARIGHAWRNCIGGENAWLDLVKTNFYPKWARRGNRKRLFRSDIRALARKQREERGEDEVVIVPPPLPEGLSPINSDEEGAEE